MLIKLLIIFNLLLCGGLYAQIKFISYNLLNYPGNDTTTRNPYFRTIIKSVDPDILVVQEITSEAAVNGFLKNVLNGAFPKVYSSGVFNDGPDSDNNVFYKSAKFIFLNNTPIRTEVRNINELRLKHLESGDTLIIYSVHLKAGSTSANVISRGKEVDSLRKVTAKLHAGANFIVCGDFNIYNSNEPAYQKLLDSGKPGYFIDDINMTGAWNRIAYAKYHTQSPRVRQFGGGSNGGMDDRFDMILFSDALKIPGGIDYIEGSLLAYGNDGLHFNDSLNRPPNLGVSQEVANALHYASDHLPVIAEFEFDKPLPVELVSFTAERISENNSVMLKWTTASELNNQGFEIERKYGRIDNWTKIGIFRGNGSNSEANYYSFTDSGIKLPGEYYYRLKQIDFNGSYNYSNEIAVTMINHIPLKATVNMVGSNSSLQVKFQSEQHIRISLYNILGQVIKTLADMVLSPDEYLYRYDLQSSGIYFFFIQSEQGNKVIKIMSIK